MMVNQKNLYVEIVMKAGNVKSEIILERFNLISGVQHTSVDINLLSSAQRARFLSWSLKNDINVEEINKIKTIKHSKDDDYLDYNINTGGVGIDVQHSSEFFQTVRIDLKTNDEITSLFTQKEIAYAETRIDPKLTLVGLFSLKEAMFKAGLVDERADNFSDLEITHDSNGKPVFPGYQLSISHSKNLVVAVAVKSMAVKKEKTQDNTNIVVNDDIPPKDNKIKNNNIFKREIIILTVIISLIVSNVDKIFPILLELFS
jgi:phosphopantetheine--protein transferase-like protein